MKEWKIENIVSELKNKRKTDRKREWMNERITEIMKDICTFCELLSLDCVSLTVQFFILTN